MPSSPRPLRWASQADVERCSRAISAACSAWLLAWSGREQAPSDVAVTTPNHAVSPGDVCSLALPDGERLCLASSGLFPWALLEDPQPGRGRPGPTTMASEVGKACEADLLARLAPALAGASAPAAVQPAWGTPWPQEPAYSGGTSFLVKWDRASLMLHLSGGLMRRGATRAAAPSAPQPLDRAALARLAANSTVRGRALLTDSSLPIGALLRAEVGDVIVLDRKLSATFQWELPELGLRLSANLVRIGDQLAIELNN